MKKILFVYDTYSLYGGGSQLLSLTWFKKIAENNFPIYYLSNNLIPKGIINNFENKILTNYLNLNTDKLIKTFRLPLIIDPQNLNFILKTNFDIIQFFEPTLLGLEILSLKKILNSKAVFYVSTLFSPNLKVKLWEKGLIELIIFLQKFFITSSDAIIFPSNYSKNYFKKYFKLKNFKHSVVIYPPIRNQFLTHEIKLKKEKPSELVVVSRLVKEKNLDLLIKTMVFLKGKFKLHIIGEGQENKNLKKLVRDLNLKNDVIFHSWVENSQLPDVLENFDIFVFPSINETFGIAPIEALAVGLPLVVFDYPLNREIIPQGTAIFVKSKKPQDWARAILKIKTNFGTYQQLLKQVKNKKHLLFKYSEENTSKKLINFYQSLVD